MELRLTVETRGRPEQEIAIDVRPDHLVGEAVAALVAHLELKGRLEIYSRRSASWLDPSLPLVEADLRTGDRVWLGDPNVRPPTGGRTAQGPLVDLLVVGGPDAGRRIPLAAGEHRVGGFRYSPYMLDDPALSPVHPVLNLAPKGEGQVRDARSERGAYTG